MRIKSIMDNNHDTTAWGGSSVMLALAGMSAMEIVVYPIIGWLSVYLLKKLVSYIEGLLKVWWENRKTETNI